MGLAMLPDRRLLGLAGLWLALGIVTVFAAEAVLLWQGYAVIVAAAALADALAARRLRGLVTVSRELPHALPVGSRPTVWLRLSLVREQRRPLRGWVNDCIPPAFAAEALPAPFLLQPGRWARLGYRLQVGERGRHRFAGVDLRLRSPFGLWLVPEHVEVPQEVRVYPDFARIAQYTLLATDNRLSQIGVLRRRRRGLGLEFHQLREYRQDDSLRQIDWKASARVRHLVSREYQDERDQQLVFLLDCGHRMRARDGALSHFDHTLNALLLLAYVALRQGDAVGLCTFGHAAPRFLPPRKSMATVNGLLNAMFDLEPSTRAPDYLEAGELLSRRLTKRSLVVLVTNLRDEDDDTLQPAVRHLRRSHAVTLASLEEPVLRQLADEPVADFDAALTRAATLEYLEARRRQAASLRHAGVDLLDVAPRELPVALINHYWARKRAGSL